MENNDSKYTFKTHFITFVSQAITGVLFPFYKELTDNGKFETYPKHYINECWDKYNNKQNEGIEEDEYNYVIVKLDKIKKNGNLKHNYCLFDLWWKFSFQILILILARIDGSMLEDFDTFKSSINELFEEYVDERKIILDNYEEKCSIIDPKKILNTEDKFINVKYVMGIC